MLNDLAWKQPALIGGLIMGILSAIPGVSAANCCFCAWALLAGLIASKLVINRAARPVKTGEGAQIGLMAGLIGAAIFIVVAVPIILSGVATDFALRMLSGVAENMENPELREMLNRVQEEAANQTPVQRLISSIPVLLGQAVILGAFTVVGGLLGVALFEKRKDQPPPPPYPPQYSPDYPPNPPANYPPSTGGYGGSGSGGQGGQAGGGQGGWPPAGA